VQNNPPLSGWAGYALGFVAAVSVTLVAVAAHGSGHPLWSLGALAATAAAVAAVTTLPGALATTALCWALDAGFVVGRHADLAFTAGTARAALVLAVAALAGYAVASVVRQLRARPAPVMTVPVPREAPLLQVLGHTSTGS
jgi:hypothetical protein